MQIIDETWVRPLYYGSLLTSCGGGEQLEILIQLLTDRLRESKVPLLDINELEKGHEYATVGIMGSMMEAHNSTGNEGIRVLERFADENQCRIDGLFTIEAASINVLYPLLLASIRKTPLIDGDCMARAFPEFQMTTAQSAGIQMTPLSLMTPKGDYFTFDDLDNLLFEVKSREIVSEEAGVAYFAGFKAIEETLKKCLIPGTITFLYRIGCCFLNTKSYGELLEKMMDVSKNSQYGSIVELFIGTVKDRPVRTENHWQEMSIEGVGNYKNSRFSILVQNEYLIGLRDKNVAAMVPDLICLIDINTLRIISQHEINRGMKVAVLSIPAPVRLKSQSMLDLIGPKCFGYNNEYIPLERLYESYYF
ncbi:MULTISPECIES: DUF917 domain-containing protein [unclassified Oceanispirochaeta]|uniref:DUF917 domain-containing protein n=1 Tax=unclassified Oceanispirochaeta TaxID=2635722 RepID=UPI000E09AD4E|nr:MULTISPECIES: DUF917 domain-containing protein [unclassified Oceanispirochaeta]MBF9016591.1 DUF917 domain-containing protein [Oceanispirochaeta sp. M2]NPD73054.1 DUF917 domain-containing protein [Oceanispirochaeta sp. M1]RDG31399.1 DUF917 domain-containing protein [Oceanispirochaeta sp. M1]